MTSTAHVTSPTLSDVWTQWCRFLNRWGSDEEAKHASVHQRLAGLGHHHPADGKHIHAVLSGLYRGGTLLLTSLRWEKPCAGGQASNISDSDQRRGEQWRLVMAYGGFETVAKALLNHRSRGGFGLSHFEALVTPCELPPYMPLEAPRLADSVCEEWLEIGSDGKAEVLMEFLGLDNGDARAVNDWLVHNQTIDSWPRAIALAKALRNVTAHGALSASKAREWKLRPAFCVLVDNLGQVVAAALARLLTDSTVPGETAAQQRRVGK